jgi:hypothetical protein
MELSWRLSCRWESLSHIFLAGIECLFPLGTRGYRIRFMWSNRSTVAMSRSNASFCILRFLATVLPCLVSFRARQICDAASQMDLIVSRASKKEAYFLVGHDLPQISWVRHLLILPWTKFSVPIIIFSFRSASYLVARGSYGMDPIVIQSRMSWYTAVHSELVLVPVRLRDMASTADVIPCAADGQVKICSMTSYSPQ